MTASQPTPPRLTLQSVTGEEDIIQTFLAPLAAAMPGALGLRDDCALATPRHGHSFVLKTDAIAAGVHFLPDDPPDAIGWKALAVNVSDLAAKGARPHGYLMSLAFPEPPTREWMAAFARGLGEAQHAFGIGLLGGDTDRRPGPISITPMVIGEVPEGRMVRRGAARPGDVVCVSGTIGDATLGLALRSDPARADAWGLDAAASQLLVDRYLRPAPRLALAPVILARARAAMDVSDGLLKDLDRMCRASGCGARIDHGTLPISDAFAAVRNGDPAAAASALFAGDDYEILCAIPPETLDNVVAEAERVGVPLTPVGVITEAAGIDLRDGGGQSMPVTRSGWDHF